MSDVFQTLVVIQSVLKVSTYFSLSVLVIILHGNDTKSQQIWNEEQGFHFRKQEEQLVRKARKVKHGKFSSSSSSSYKGKECALQDNFIGNNKRIKQWQSLKANLEGKRDRQEQRSKS